MIEAPESKFGLKDILAIAIALIVFALAATLLPDQSWVTEDPTLLLLVRLVIALILAIGSWVVLIKFLIPSDSEIIDLNVKRQIAGGKKEILEDAAEIKSLGYKLPGKYSTHVVELGSTIERIMDQLNDPNLQDITKIESKLFRFVNLLKQFQMYATGQKRTTTTAMNQLTEIFEESLKLTTIAMDNLELNLSLPDLSGAAALAKTLQDLYQIDGLLENRGDREQREQLRQKISKES